MAEFTGQNMVLQWIYTGGTATISGDYRKFDFPPARDLVESSAGSDTGRTDIATLWNYTCALTAVMQTGGTVLEDALVSGTNGTIICGPEGTASGKRKYTIPAMSLGANFNFQYDQVVELNCSFKSQGAPTYGAY